MRGWLAIPLGFVVAVLILLPVAALTETGPERSLKEWLDFDLGECEPTTNLASSWREGPDLTFDLDEPRAGVINGKVYLVGGTTDITGIVRDHPVLVPSDQLTRFDPRTGEYEELAPLPQPLNHVYVAPYKGKLYVLGGYGRWIDTNTHKGFFRYDPRTDRWSRLPDLPVPRSAGATGILGGRLIVATGAKDSKAQSDVFAFDFSTRSWSRLADIPSRREHVGAAVVGGKLYVLGGRAPQSLAVDTAARYDPRADRWERLPPMPVPAGGLAAVAADGKVLAIGGGDEAAGTVTGAVQEFDPGTGTWTLLPSLRTPRHGHASAVADGRIWVFGGSGCAGFSAISHVESLPVQSVN